MIKNDFRYIIKKIIIGLGIFIGIFYFKSCNVNASNNIDFTYQVNTSFPYYRTASMKPTYNLNVDFNYNIDMTNYNYYLVLLQVNYSSADTITIVRSNTKFTLNGSYTTWGSYYNTYYNKIVCNLTTNSCTETNSTTYSGFSIYSNSFAGTLNNLGYISNNNIILTGNYDMFDKPISYFENGNLNDYVPPPNNPEIVSLNAELNKTNSDMLVSVSFSPEFTYVDTDNYNYYAWFEGEKKFLLTENNIDFNTQQNTTFYVEITDKQGNTIDSETYTITSIGLIYNGTYDIQFSTTELTSSDTINDSDLVIDEINRIDIDITYIPKWVNYKYQYQWVNENGSLSDNWTTINVDSDKNNYTYVTRVNGTLYARILDTDNNVLKSSTYTITRIGELKTYDKNSNKIFTMFNNINNDINFSGPISNLIVMPVNLLETILQAGSSQCSPYYLGTIGGHPLTLTCVNPQNYLGSSLWSLIDIIVSGCLIYSIAKWLTSLYWNFVMLQNTPDINPETFGDRRDLL